MAKLSAVNKNKKRIRLSDKLYKKRQALKKIVMILSLLVGGSNVILASDFSQSTFLFCLKSDIQPLSISKSNNKLSVDNSSIQNFIDNYSIENIEPWLPGARETDHDGDIYLNRYLHRDQFLEHQEAKALYSQCYNYQ